MYFISALITGILIAVMIVANGELGEFYGLYTSTAIIHLVGLIFIAIVYLFKKKTKLPSKKLPFYLYLGGTIGVATIVFNNMAFGKISVSAILALGLLGQSVTSIIIDQYGLFKMQQSNFSKSKLIGLSFVLLGILIMMEFFKNCPVVPVIVAVLTGFTVVVSRTINARFAEETSMLKSTLFNYITGFAVALVIMFIVGRGEPSFTSISISPRILMYTGGIIGVFTIMLLNVTVAKIPSFYMTLLLFTGQVFAGIIIDVILTQSFSLTNLIGGSLVAVGLSINVWIDNRKEQMAKQEV